jgi:hypothetical protein
LNGAIETKTRLGDRPFLQNQISHSGSSHQQGESLFCQIIQNSEPGLTVRGNLSATASSS